MPVAVEDRFCTQERDLVTECDRGPMSSTGTIKCDSLLYMRLGEKRMKKNDTILKRDMTQFPKKDIEALIENDIPRTASQRRREFFPSAWIKLDEDVEKRRYRRDINDPLSRTRRKMKLRDLMDHLLRKRKGQQSGSGVDISVDPSRPEGHDEWRSAVKKLYQVLSQGRTDHVVETTRLQKRQNIQVSDDHENVAKHFWKE